MNIRPETVSVEAEITINSKEAEVLEHLLSYGYADWFAKTCSHRFKADLIQSSLGQLRASVERIMAAHRRAVAAITGREEAR